VLLAIPAYYPTESSTALPPTVSALATPQLKVTHSSSTSILAYYAWIAVPTTILSIPIGNPIAATQSLSGNETAKNLSTDGSDLAITDIYSKSTSNSLPTPSISLHMSTSAPS